MTDTQQSRPLTTDEQLKMLFDRTAKLGDRMAALFSPAWGASTGLLPEDHPLHPGVVEPLPSTVVPKPRLLDCGLCYEEDGEEVHPHPECPIGYADPPADVQGEQGAPVDWQAIAKQRERELKTIGEARHSAEQAVAELAQAIRLTREYVGGELLPAVEGWSWYDALRRHAPDELPPCTCTGTDVGLNACSSCPRPWPDTPGANRIRPRTRMATESGTPPTGPAGASTPPRASIHASDVAGFCPACGHGVLMLGSGGHVTCTLMDCPNPSAADQLLHGDSAAAGPAATGAAEIPSYGPAEWTPDHYRGDGLQPFDVINAFGLDFYEGNAIKYVLRWRKKNGVQDLRKARTYVQILIDRAEQQVDEPRADAMVVVHHMAKAQASASDEADENGPDPDACRPVDIGGETIRVHGAGEMSATSRAALAEIVDAARRKYEQEYPPYEVDDAERRERYAQALYVTLEVTRRRLSWAALIPQSRTVWYRRAEAAMAMADVELAAAASCKEQ